MTSPTLSGLTVVEDTEIEADWGNTVAKSVVLVYASATARDSDITAPTEGMHAYLADINQLTVYNGTSWVVALYSPACQVRATGSTQSIANTTSTPVLMDTEDYDPLAWHSTSSNTSRITPNIAGWVRAYGKVSYNVNATGRRFASILKNGGTVPGSSMVAATSAGGVVTVATEVLVQVNGTTDYLELEAVQDSGSSILTYVGGAGSGEAPLFIVEYARPS